MIYLLDTNVIADCLNQQFMIHRLNQAIGRQERVCLCRPVYYETLRGLLKVQAQKKLQILHNKLIPMLEWVELRKIDWEQSAQFWAGAVNQGKQLSDVDLLIAAIAICLNATIVSADTDFDSLPIKRINWRVL